MMTEQELRIYKQYYEFAKQLESSTGDVIVDEYQYLFMLARKIEMTTAEITNFLRHRRNGNAIEE